MADIPNGNQVTPTPPGEPSMEKRLLLAFILMGAVLFLMPSFYKYLAPQQQPAKKPVAQQTQQTQQTQQAAQPAKPVVEAAKPEAAPAPAPASAVAAAKEETYVVDTPLYRVVLSNRGAVVRSWVLKKYKDGLGKPLDLVSAAGAAKTAYPFALTYKDKRPGIDVNQALFVGTPGADGLSFNFEYAGSGIHATKSIRFQKDSYLADLAFAVTQNGAPLATLVEWRGGFGDHTVQGAATNSSSLHCEAGGSALVLRAAKEAKDGPVTDWGNYAFAGIEDRYFAAVFLPPTDFVTALRTYHDNVKGLMDAKEEPYVGAAVGGSAYNHFGVFVGPKDLDILKQVNPKLEQLVDFGKWFGWLAKPLFLVVSWINNQYTHNYGWAIVIITVLINFAILPFRLKSMKSMKKMQALQPQINAINAKYKNVGLRDPRKQDQNAEVMDLYKKHGVNPMGGCLPMLFQMPPMIAFYTVLTVAIEMRGASWLWVMDLSQPEHYAIKFLPIAMIIAQFVMQKMTPTPGQDPAQARMMLIMPLVFGFMFYNMSSGLVLYWLTSNLVGIAQQWFINRTMPVSAPQAAPAPKGKKGGK